MEGCSGVHAGRGNFLGMREKAELSQHQRWDGLELVGLRLEG